MPRLGARSIPSTTMDENGRMLLALLGLLDLEDDFAEALMVGARSVMIP